MTASNTHPEFPPQKESNKAEAMMLIVEIMYEIARLLSQEPSKKNRSVPMKQKVENALRGMRLSEAFQNAGVKVRAENAWLFFPNALSDEAPKTEELRSTPLPAHRTGKPQLVFATGMSLRAGETNYTRLPGSVTFVRDEWRERQTLFTKEACKRHRVHPALLAEMLGEKTGIYAWIVDPQRSTAFTASQRLAAETLLLSPRPTKSQVWVSGCQTDNNITQARHIIVGDLYAQSRLVYRDPPFFVQ